MSIFRKLQHNARVHRERINQENFGVMLGVNIGGINKELAIARGAFGFLKILIVEMSVGCKDIEARGGSGSSDSLLRDKTRVKEIIMKVDDLPARRSNHCVVLLLTLTYIHMRRKSPESPIKIVGNGKAERVKRLDMTDITFNQGRAKKKRGRVFFVVLQSLHSVGHGVDAVLHTVKDGTLVSSVEPCSLEEVVDCGLGMLEERDIRKEGKITMQKF